MSNNFKVYIRKLVNKFSKYSIIYNNAFDLNKILGFYKINLVLDIGAYTGTYSLSLRRFGYKGKIISFEPIKNSHKKLLINSSSDKNWIIYERVALGNKQKYTNINISQRNDNSSILNVNKNHTKLVPESKYISKDKVKMIKLDRVIKDNLKKKNCLLKIDTQGYEYEILLGAGKELKKVKLIQIELSLEELYRGQANWEKNFKYLNKLGFKIWSIYPGFKNKKNGQLMQFDMILYR